MALKDMLDSGSPTASGVIETLGKVQGSTGTGYGTGQKQGMELLKLLVGSELKKSQQSLAKDRMALQERMKKASGEDKRFSNLTTNIDDLRSKYIIAEREYEKTNDPKYADEMALTKKSLDNRLSEYKNLYKKNYNVDLTDYGFNTETVKEESFWSPVSSFFGLGKQYKDVTTKKIIPTDSAVAPTTSQYKEGTIATDKQGRKAIYKNGKWEIQK